MGETQTGQSNMTHSGESVMPTIASDEDMDWGYVLVAEAERVLREQALSQWGYRLGDVEFERRQWFKPAEADGADGGDLERCDADDPAADSEANAPAGFPGPFVPWAGDWPASGYRVHLLGRAVEDRGDSGPCDLDARAA